MPFVFLVFGALFLIVAIRGTQGDFFALIKSEMWGPQSFLPWASAILILGMAGYIKTVRPITDGLIGLILLAIILKDKGGVFTQFNAALANPVASAAPASNAVGAAQSTMDQITSQTSAQSESAPTPAYQPNGPMQFQMTAPAPAYGT